MLRSKYRKRRNKKGGRSFMEAFAQGSGDLQNYASQAGEGLKTGVTKTRQGFNDFENARQGAVTKTGMDAGFNPFKKKEDPFERSPENPGQSETLNPLNTAVQRAANQREMEYSKKYLEGLNYPGYKAGGKRKKRKTHKKRKMRKRKTRKSSAGMYSVSERNRLKNLEEKIPLNLLMRTRNMPPKEKEAEFKKIGITIKDLKGMKKMRDEKKIEAQALKAHRDMMQMEEKKKKETTIKGGRKRKTRKRRKMKKRKTRRKRRR